MSNEALTGFLFKARGKTAAKLGGEVDALIPGTEQTEFAEGDYLYRDVYYDGQTSFSGLEAILFRGQPVWAGSYYGKCQNTDWAEIDPILQKVQNDYPETDGWVQVDADYDNYHYSCTPDSYSNSIDEIGGYESITRDGEEIYTYYYAGSLLT